MDATAECTKCKSKASVIPVVYGRPNDVLQQQAQRGEVKLEGCSPSNPKWHCKSYNLDF
jgi:hypothetical protein